MSVVRGFVKWTGVGISAATFLFGVRMCLGSSGRLDAYNKSQKAQDAIVRIEDGLVKVLDGQDRQIASMSKEEYEAQFNELAGEIASALKECGAESTGDVKSDWEKLQVFAEYDDEIDVKVEKMKMNFGLVLGIAGFLAFGPNVVSAIHPDYPTLENIIFSGGMDPYSMT